MKQNSKLVTRNPKQKGKLEKGKNNLLFVSSGFGFFSDFSKGAQLCIGFRRKSSRGGFRISSLKTIFGATSIIILLFLNSNAFAYERIISLIPSATKSLYLLGLGDKVSAVTIYCPPEAKNKEKIGTVLDPDIEKIVTLKPDLVVASKEGNREATVVKLRKMGITVYVMDITDNFDQICGGLLQLGAFLKKDKEAAKVITGCRQRIQKLSLKTKNVKPVNIFWEVSANPLFTAGKGSFANDYISFAGGRNIFAGINGRYPQVSREEVVRLDPDAIVIVTMGDVTEKEIAAWMKFSTMKAVKSRSVYTVSETLFTDPTPVSVVESAEKLYAILHGKNLSPH